MSLSAADIQASSPAPSNSGTSNTNSHSSEASPLRTVDFLSTLSKNGYVRDYRVVDNDRLVERCYFSCSQAGPSSSSSSLSGA